MDWNKMNWVGIDRAQTLQDAVAATVADRDVESSGGLKTTMKCDAHHIDANNLWMVRRTVWQDQTISRSIVCARFREVGGKWQRCEIAEGPFFNDIELTCPLEFLDMVPCNPDRGGNRQWRRDLLSYNEELLAEKYAGNAPT